MVKALFRNKQGALVAILGQEPFYVSRERYVAIKLQPRFDDLPIEGEPGQVAAPPELKLRGHHRPRIVRTAEPATAQRKARS